MKKTLIIMIGNIGSGKSTETKALVDKGYVSISRDAFRYLIGAGKYIFNIALEPVIEKMNKNTFRQFIKIGSSIVLDETNVTKRQRKYYIKYALKNDYKVVALEMPPITMNDSVKRRLRNNHGNTPKEVWQEVWTRFNKSYQAPSYEEGFTEIVVRQNCRG